MVGWLKALLFVAGGVVAATGTAYYTGLLDPILGREDAVIASLPQEEEPEQTPEPEVAAEEAVPQPQEQTVAADKQDRLVVPSFDLLRVEPDGSVLIAGKASPDAKVEVLLGDTVLATTDAGPGGDFVAIFDNPLQPGDYQLSLRAMSGDKVATSVETAIVSVPENAGGEVLAMIEAPGQPAELVTVPQTTPQEQQSEQAAAQPEAQIAAAGNEDVAEDEPEQPAEASAQDTSDTSPATQDDAATAQDDAAPDEEQLAKAEEQPAPAGEETARPEQAPTEAAPAQQPAAPVTAPVTASVTVDAVEIEGDTIFVAGQAAPGASVRVYAGEILLGDAKASDGGRFLVEAKRDLPVGSYVIRADSLGADGSVLARAAVPFEREPGEAVAAVAPPPAGQTPEKDASTTGKQTTEEQPATTDAPAAQPQAEAETDVAAAGETPDAQAVTAPPLQRADGSVIIRRGDSLWRISRRVYGHGVRYSTIYLANQDQIADPNRIWPGQIFTVPHATSEGDEADMSAVGDQSVTPAAEPAARQ